MEKLTIIFDVAEEIMVGLKSGKYLQKGGVIVDSQTHRVVKWLNEASASKISAVASFGFTPAMIGLTVVTTAGFLFMNAKLNKIQEQLLDIKTDLTEIKEILSEVKEIVSETQEYEIGKLFADFKTNLQEAELLVLENKAESLLNLRREFIKISNRVRTLIEIIERKGKIILLREVYFQYLELYHACVECALRCSMAGNEYKAARILIDKSAEQFTEIQKIIDRHLLTRRLMKLQIFHTQKFRSCKKIILK